MRGAVVLASTLAAMVSFADLSAQTPDFTGSWTMVAPAGGAPPAGGGGPGGGGRGGGGGGRGGLGMSAMIAQTAATLTINRMQGGAQIASVYNLDGSPSTNTLSAGGQSIQQVSRAVWDGSRLVITTDGQAGATTMVLSLNAQGALVVESTAPGRGGGVPTTTSLTYTKN